MRLSFYQHRRLASARKSTVKYEDGYANGINRKKNHEKKTWNTHTKEILRKKEIKWQKNVAIKGISFFYVIPSAEPEEHKLNNAS